MRTRHAMWSARWSTPPRGAELRFNRIRNWPGPDRGGPKVVDFTRPVSSRIVIRSHTKIILHPGSARCPPANRQTRLAISSYDGPNCEVQPLRSRRRQYHRGQSRNLHRKRGAAESPSSTRHAPIIFSLLVTLHARVSGFTGRSIFFQNFGHELSGSKVCTHTQSSYTHAFSQTLPHNPLTHTIPSNTLLLRAL